MTRTGADQGGDFLDALRRRGQRGESRGADAARCEHGADAADGAALPQALQGGENRRLVGADFQPDLGKRMGDDRKVTLPVVEQRVFEWRVWAVHDQNPMRAARLVKKMPEGASAGPRPRCWKLRVS